MSKDQQPIWNWRTWITCYLTVGLSGLIIYSLFDYLAARTHQEIFSWLGIIAIPVILLPAMVILGRIMRKQKRAQAKEL